MSLLEVRNLRTYFFTRRGVVKAVDGVSFSLKESEVLGLVGESGCGKSITGLSILRLVPEPAGRIVEGEITLDGEDLLKKSKQEMREIRGNKLSMILQDPRSALNPLLSVGDQVTEPIKVHQHLKGRTAWNKAVNLLQRVRIPSPETYLRSWPHQLSGGMAQRVVGAISLSCEPRLIIADEPTTSLDATVQLQYLNLLRELQASTKLALIFITHDFGIVARMCHRVAVMYAGKIVENAGVREIYNQPKHPYTAALMKSVPRPDIQVQRLTSIGGQPPPLHSLPPGCAFLARCQSAGDKCRLMEYPPAVEVEDGHFVSCWKYA